MITKDLAPLIAALQHRAEVRQNNITTHNQREATEHTKCSIAIEQAHIDELDHMIEQLRAHTKADEFQNKVY